MIYMASSYGFLVDEPQLKVAESWQKATVELYHWTTEDIIEALEDFILV